MSRGYGAVRKFELQQTGTDSKEFNNFENPIIYEWDESEKRSYGRGIFLTFLIVLSIFGTIAYFHLDSVIGIYFINPLFYL